MRTPFTMFLLLIVFDSFAQYTITVEQNTPAAAPGSVYRVYINALFPTDRLESVYGDVGQPLWIYAPEGIHNNPLNPSWNASGIESTLFGIFPDLQDDSYATIGLDGPASLVLGAEDPLLIEDPNLSSSCSEFFTSGGDTLHTEGSAWFAFGSASNKYPDEDERWLIAQITTSGEISGRINFHVLSEETADDTGHISFHGPGIYNEYGEVVAGCTDSGACNFNPTANEEDESCVYIPEGFCDCNGNEEDALGVCGGTCPSDYNSNEICDDEEVYGCTDVDACNYNDEANVDDGSCEGTPIGWCDCFHTVPDTDNDGVCDEDEIVGCDNTYACNYVPEATENDGSCVFCNCTNQEPSLCWDPYAINYGFDHPWGCAYLNGDVQADSFEATLSPTVGGGGLTFGDFENWCSFVNPLSEIQVAISISFEANLPPLQVSVECETPVVTDEYSLDDYQAYWSFNAFCYPEQISLVLGCDTLGLPLPQIEDYLDSMQLNPSIHVAGASPIIIESPYDSVSVACNVSGLDLSLIEEPSELRLEFGLVFGGEYDTAESWPLTTALSEFSTSDYGEGAFALDLPVLSNWNWYDSCSQTHFIQIVDNGCGAIIAEDTFDLSLQTPGCLDSGACNYNESPCAVDGFCDYETCTGCSDPLANNFSFALIDDGSCEYPWDNCEGISQQINEHPTLSLLFDNYDPLSFPGWRTQLHPGEDLFWDQFEPTDTLGLFSWFVQYDESIEFEPGLPVVLPLDSTVLYAGTAADASLVVCVPRFMAEPLSQLPFGISMFKLNSVAGMPDGLNAQIAESTFAPASAFCVPIVGQTSEAGIFPITLYAEANVTLFGQPIVYDNLQINYTLVVSEIGGEPETFCQDSTACNFGEPGLECLFLDECGDCGGPGIEEGSCDCDGNVWDALGVCGGGCSSDLDNDGVCDIDDDCIGELDSCGICGGDNTACMGCTYHEATNFNQTSVVDDGSCVFDIGGSCQGDLNDDSVIGIDDILLMLSVYDTTCPQ